MGTLTPETRAALLSGRSSRRMYAVATEDYSRPWLKITVPKGTIVPVILFSDPPDMFHIDGADWLDFALGTVFELMI